MVTSKSTDSTITSQGVIRTSELYTLDEFKRRLKITDATLRAARRAGLQVYRLHKRTFVYGQDWINHVVQTGRGNGGR